MGYSSRLSWIFIVWVIEERFRIVVIDLKSHKVVRTNTNPSLNEYVNHTTSNTIKIDDHFITTVNGNELLIINCKNDKISFSEKQKTRPELFRYIKNDDSTFIAFSSIYKCFFKFAFSKQKLSYKKIPIKN